MVPEWLKFLGAGLGLLISSGIVQFFINRYDARHDKFKALDDKIEKGLEDREEKGRERYEEHRDAIEELAKAMTKLAEAQARQEEKFEEWRLEQREISTANSELLVGLAQNTLVHLTEKYTSRGAITLDELAVLEEIYLPYHTKLHGNGRGKAGVEACRELPKVSEEIAHMKDKEVHAV